MLNEETDNTYLQVKAMVRKCYYCRSLELYVVNASYYRWFKNKKKALHEERLYSSSFGPGPVRNNKAVCICLTTEQFSSFTLRCLK